MKGSANSIDIPDRPFDASGWRFLMTEISCGLTFVSVAKIARPEQRERYKRSVSNARKAYATVIRFYSRVEMNDEQMTQLSAGLSRLESELKELGGLGGFIPESPAAGPHQPER
jgi:hypothetical protein